MSKRKGLILDYIRDLVSDIRYLRKVDASIVGPLEFQLATLFRQRHTARIGVYGIPVVRHRGTWVQANFVREGEATPLDRGVLRLT